VDHDMKMLMEKTSESLETEEKSLKKLLMIIMNMIEEEYQDSCQLINN
jgi:hypothetical protein